MVTIVIKPNRQKEKIRQRQKKRKKERKRRGEKKWPAVAKKKMT